MITNKHFKEWIWTKAGNAWSDVASWIGFDNVKIAFMQGFYRGYNQALRDIEEEGLEQLITKGGSNNEKDGPNTP